MCYYQTPDGKQTYTGMPGVVGSMLAKNGTAYPFGGDPGPSTAAAPLYPNGPSSHPAQALPTINQPAGARAAPVEADPGLTITPAKQLGGVSQGSGLNVPR